MLVITPFIWDRWDRWEMRRMMKEADEEIRVVLARAYREHKEENDWQIEREKLKELTMRLQAAEIAASKKGF